MISPCLLSPNFKTYKLIVDSHGCLKTEHIQDVIGCRVTIKSFDDYLFELRVNNHGKVIIQMPPKPNPPPPEKVFVENSYGCKYELLINRNSTIQLESLSFRGLEPLRIWYAPHNYQSGLKDVKVSVYLGTSLIVSDLLLYEIGNSGVYVLYFTPSISGDYLFKISSDSSQSIIKRNVLELEFDNLVAELNIKSDKIN